MQTFTCQCGKVLRPYLITGELYHETVVVVTPEILYWHRTPPPADEVNDRDSLWWDYYQGDLVYAASYATVEAWVSRPGGSVHDMYNADGRKRYTAPAHTQEVA